MFDMVFIVSEACGLGFQSIGQRTPCFATAWKASSRRKASNTLRPTVRLFNVIWVFGQRLIPKAWASAWTHLLYESFAIDDEHAPQTDTLFFHQHAIVPAKLVGCVAQQGYVDVA